MNVNSFLTSLLAPVQPPAKTAAIPAGSPAASPSTDPGAQFKAQFGQAVAAQSTQATTGSTTATAATPAGAAQAALQKKIADLLAAGDSVQEIVQQLAGALANIVAGHLGGNPAQILTQLQATFASALSPPGNGPPVAAADLASTLAQRFRQIAGLAAGVIGETGQSNGLFAGSFSDAATTAGGQPPQASITGTTADSSASNATALLANLTASQGDGKTVATTAPAIGTNGDTLLGRILARASTPPASSAETGPSSPVPSAPAGATGTDASASLVDRAIVAATALLGTPTAPALPAAVTSPVDALASLASANARTASATATGTVTATATATNVAPSVAAFVKSFTDALAATGRGVASGTPDKLAPDDADGIATVLPTTVASSQAPTIGAFAPVAPALHVDALAANPTPVPQQPAAPDSNAVIEQVLRGAFLSTTGDSSTVRLKLVPESLGDVSVRLAINGSSVDAQVIAQTPAAHDALVAGQAQLARALSDAGLKLTSFNVSLGGGFASFQQQQQQSGQQPGPSGRRLLLGDVDSPETDDGSLAAVPSFAPPSTAASGWGAYNYLV